MEILFVCSGNIIRSPLAEGLLKTTLERIGVANVIVSSAGTLGIEGAPADPEARRLALERGFALDAHRSRSLRKNDVRRADMIVVMERAHLHALEAYDPTALARARLIREFEREEPSGQASDLDDPVSAGSEALGACLETLERCVTNLAFRLKHRHEP